MSFAGEGDTRIDVSEGLLARSNQVEGCKVEALREDEGCKAHSELVYAIKL